MFGTSTARVRQFLTLITLFCIFVCSLIIMSLVGVNGKITFPSLDKGCLLYMTIDGDVTTYNNGFCLFPIIAAAITGLFSLFFLFYWAMVLHRRDEFSPRPVSVLFLFMALSLAMLSFAVCGEIGIGLNKACKSFKEKVGSCRSNMNFRALYAAEIIAGIMGGLWLLAMLLELFQLKGRPRLLATNTVDIAGQTTVVPSTHKTAPVPANSNISNPNANPNLVSTSTTHVNPASTSVPTSAQAHVAQQQQQPQQQHQKSEVNEMAFYPAQTNQDQQQYYQPTSVPNAQQLPQQQYYQPAPQTQAQQLPQQQYYQPTQ
ncbi:hypothetical protein BGX33_008623 [Mortierella sp. NVP41]|nr:hypothetical protein BGX33_008623 [Mortierella sp. NVP41]